MQRGVVSKPGAAPKPGGDRASGRRRRSLALALFALAACDLGPVTEAPVPAECTAIGARCQRPDGPIGVCQMTKCAPGVAPPCYACTPQH